MRALYRKELSSFLYTLNGYIFIFFILLFSGVFFSIFNISGNNGNLENTVSMISYIFLLAVPVLTMKSYAFEKENGTATLISILPISRLKIALSKYFALLTLFSISLVAVSAYPIIISVNGGGDIVWAFCSLFGLFLFGSLLISIGMFISSLSQNSAIATVLTFTCLLIMYLYGTIQLVIPYDATINFIIILILALFLGWVFYMYTRHPATAIVITAISALTITVIYLASDSLYYGAVYNILSFFSISSGFYSFSSGIFTLKGLVFYISFTALFIFLTSVLPEHKGINPKNALPEHVRQIKKANGSCSAYYSIICILLAAITIGINLLFIPLPENSINFDLTANRYYTISNAGKAFLSSLDSEVSIYLVSSKENKDSTLALYIDNLKKESSNIKVSHIDRDLYPDFYKAYSDTSISDNSIIITGEDGSAIIRNEDMYLYGISFMDNEIAAEINYDSAMKVYNAYLDTYLDDYGIDVSGYIAYYPTHHTREQVLLSAISSCCEENDLPETDNIKPISISSPSPDFTETKKLFLSVVFSVLIPASALIVGITVVNLRKKTIFTKDE